jgi:hypothetical protein
LHGSCDLHESLLAVEFLNTRQLVASRNYCRSTIPEVGCVTQLLTATIGGDVEP